jgi:hypothetical protein
MALQTRLPAHVAMTVVIQFSNQVLEWVGELPVVLKHQVLHKLHDKLKLVGLTQQQSLGISNGN